MAVHHGKVRVDGDRARRRGVETEEAGALLPRREDCLVRDLELAEDGIVRRQADCAEGRVRAGRYGDRRLARCVNLDERHARRRVGLLQQNPHACRAKARERARRYSWDAVTDEYEQLLVNVREKSGPGGLPSELVDTETGQPLAGTA